jgi:hypothetical protein
VAAYSVESAIRLTNHPLPACIPEAQKQAMPKFLRYLDVRFGVGSTFNTWREEVRPQKEVWQAPVHQIPALFRRLALPIPAADMTKLNVCFSLDGNGNPFPGALNIGYVWEYFDQALFVSLPAQEQQRFYLERLRRAVLRMAIDQGWNSDPINAACEQVNRDGFQADFLWKKPVTSTDRAHTAQLSVYIGSQFTDLYVVFINRQSREAKRVHFARVHGEDPELFAKKLQWADERTVSISSTNGKDYWQCSLDGTVQYRSPKAEAGDPHAIFALGKLYHEGGLLLQDRRRGIDLIRQAAAMGFKHAVRYIDSVESS